MNAANALNTMCAGLILIAALGMVTTRQVQGVVRFFVLQSVLLAFSALALGFNAFALHLWSLAAITVAAKVIVIPSALSRLLPEGFYERREIAQAINIPTSLLIALGLTIAAEYLAWPLTHLVKNSAIAVNVPIGLACLLIGAYALMARREAIPQLIGILAMENGVFFAGIAIAPELPLIAELAVAVDVILIAVVVGVLSRTIRKELGTTAAAELSELKEEASAWN